MLEQMDCAQWLVKAKEKFGASADTTGSRNELEDRLEKIQVRRGPQTLAKQMDCAQWLVKAKEKIWASVDTTGSRNELEDRLEKIQVQGVCKIVSVLDVQIVVEIIFNICVMIR